MKRNILSFVMVMVLLALPINVNATESKPEVRIDKGRYSDHMEYVFITDAAVIGKWETIDFVSSIHSFDPSFQNTQPSDLYLKGLEFLADGTVKRDLGKDGISTFKWTKGYFFMSTVIPAYYIERIDGFDYLFFEWKSGDYVRQGIINYYVLMKPSDIANRGESTYTSVLKGIQAFDDVRALNDKKSSGNIFNLNLVKFGHYMLTLTFNEGTKFPSRNKLPESDIYQPSYILETGKNPGLGVRSIHEQGITGKGVNVAIIDQPLYDDHPEYAGKIVEYKDFDCGVDYSMHGPLAVSLLAGNTTGTAPGVNIYYAAVPTWKGDALDYANALDWIVEINKKLPTDEKIRIVSISGAPTSSNPQVTKNGKRYLDSYKKAEATGLLILDCTPENGFIGSSRYDFTDPDDITLVKPFDVAHFYGYQIKPKILAPISRTSAEQYRKNVYSYQYQGNGGWSSAVPYVAGVLALGWQVNPKLTANEIVDILLETAHVDRYGEKHVNPVEFISYIKSK